MTQQASLFEDARHSHLRLAAVADPGPRQPRPPGFGRPTVYTDRAGHGRRIEQQVTTIKAQHRRRSRTLGIDPELVLVLETNGPLDPVDVERAGLVVLEIRSDRALIAFAADPEMSEFVARNQQYQQGTRGTTEKGNERQAAYEHLFDRIDAVRSVNNEDVIGAELAAALAAPSNGEEPRRLEVHCWCPEEADEARRRNAEIQAAIRASEGRVLATSVRESAGWSVVCCEMPLSGLEQVLATQRVSWIDLMPEPTLSLPLLLNATADSLPLVSGPRPDAPILAVIDSGIRGAHPLLAPAVVGAEVVGAGLGDGGDESGHGTLVASLALFGSLEPLLDAQPAISAAGRLLGIRVLDGANRFPDDRIWAELVLEAMEVATSAGARVINVSIGDDRRPYLPPRPSSVGALLDQFIRSHPDVVVVTCTGNLSPVRHIADRLISNEYIEDLLHMPDSGILDPGTSSLAITVGGVGRDLQYGAGAASAEKVVVGGPRLPSPHTRVGPGPMAAIKPELAAPSGTVVVDTLVGRASTMDKLGHVIGAGGSQPDRLLASDQGTSYAAPLVSHAALRVLGRYPQLTGNSVRALLLVGAQELPDYLSDGAQGRTDERRLTGYGLISAERSEASSDHRAVLLSESSIRMDQVHFYSIPVPSSFRASGGLISMAAALAFDPPVRVTRLDYMASKMGFQIFHGPSVDEVREAYVRAESADELEEDVAATPSSLSRYRLDLQPADTARSRGANQFGRYSRHTRLSDERPDHFVLALRSLNRWDTPEAEQSYSLAVLLERDDDHPGIYADLSLELEALAVEVEVELEAGGEAGR